jgi:hypothetical protein
MSPSDFHDDPRPIVSDRHGRWSRPTAAVDLARCLKDLVRMPTPIPRLDRAASSVGCSTTPQRPSPYVRRVGSSKTLSRPAQSSRVSACALAPWLRQGIPRRLQPGNCSPRLLQWLPDVPTIPRAGLTPAGLRDPGGLHTLNSTPNLPSCRTDNRCNPPRCPCANRARSSERPGPALGTQVPVTFLRGWAYQVMLYRTALDNPG